MNEEPEGEPEGEPEQVSLRTPLTLNSELSQNQKNL